ncbi:MAG: glycosyltransferase family 39 protein [Deltaproteobacteria bacterium]|nr:glycosyltransferase family 39 protein [Deltaproteobacteria bacterium]
MRRDGWTTLHALPLLLAGLLGAWPVLADEPQQAVQDWQAPAGTHVLVTPGDPVTLQLQRGDQNLRVLVARRPTDSLPPGVHALPSLIWFTDPRQPAPEWQPVLDSLAQALRQRDHGQFRDPPRRPTPQHPPPPPVLVGLTWLLLALAAAALPWALWRAMRTLRNHLPAWEIAGGLALMLLPRVLAPHRMVMVHFGYLHVDQARTLAELPRYGPATTLLDHAWFALTGAHHAAVQWLHVGLGTLTVLPIAAMALRLGGPVAARWAAILLALAPFSWLDHGSESMLVPALLAWWSALVLVGEFVAGRKAWALAGAAVLLTLCGLCRPDALLVALPTALLVAWPGRADRRLWGALAALALTVGLLWLPDLAYLRGRTAEDVAMGNLPRLDEGLADLPRRFLHGWLPLDPRWFPAGATLLATVGLTLDNRGPLLRLWAAALLWALPMFVDFNDTSKLRLHAPSAMLILLAAAVVAARLQVQARQGLAVVVGGGLLVGSALATAPAVLAPQLSDASEVVMAQAARLARDGQPTALVVRSYVDEPARGVHLFWPDYLLEPGDRWLSVRDWQAGQLRPGERALGVVDVRCWAHLAEQSPQLGSNGLHPACQTLLSARAPILWHAAVANVGERGFAWYVPAERAPSFAQVVLDLGRKQQ